MGGDKNRERTIRTQLLYNISNKDKIYANKSSLQPC